MRKPFAYYCVHTYRHSMKVRFYNSACNVLGFFTVLVKLRNDTSANKSLKSERWVNLFSGYSLFIFIWIRLCFSCVSIIDDRQCSRCGMTEIKSLNVYLCFQKKPTDSNLCANTNIYANMRQSSGSNFFLNRKDNIAMKGYLNKKSQFSLLCIVITVALSY